MSAILKPIAIAIAALACAGLLYSAVNKWYLAPRRTLIEDLDGANATLARHRDAAQKKAGVSRDLQAIVDRTLGGSLESADHRLRTRLNRLAEQSKLQGVSVGTDGSGRPKGTPARVLFSSASYKPLRDEIDFVEVEASISGVGALADVVRLITAIEAEPWIKRIDEVRLDPRDNGARLNVSLRLTTLFLPGREPKTEQPAQPPNPELQSRFAALVSGNPFRVPPPPAPPAPPKTEQPAAAAPAPPPFPFGEWALTGVAQGPSGVEAWLRHQPSGQTRVLAPGQALDAMVFHGAARDAEAAEFTLGEQHVIVAVGSTMDQRSPAGQ